MTVRGKKIWNMVLILMAVLVGLVFLFPVFWMVRSSFMGLEELYANPPVFLPKNTTLQNYQAALSQTDLWLQLRNSCVITLLFVMGTVISSSLTAYGFSRFEMGYASAIATLLFLIMILCKKAIQNLLGRVGT